MTAGADRTADVTTPTTAGIASTRTPPIDVADAQSAASTATANT